MSIGTFFRISRNENAGYGIAGARQLQVCVRTGLRLLGEINFNSTFRGDITMADKIEVCMCDKCGNEAEMTISCQLVDVREPSGEVLKKQKETRTCKVCGNEADMIIDFGD